MSGIVSDISGKKLMDIPSKVFNAGVQKMEVNTQSLPAGIYQLQVSIGNKISTRKLSVAR